MIFLDVDMPVMNGKQTYIRIQKLKKEYNIGNNFLIIIFCTAYQNDYEQISNLLDPNDEILTKPVL